MKKEMSVLEAKNQAQRIAFAPLFYQAIVAARDLGVLSFINKHRKGVAINDIVDGTDVSEYGVNLLLEACAEYDVIEYLDKDTVKLTMVGFMMIKDDLTRVNVDFIRDVCYLGGAEMKNSIVNSKPEGLKVLGDWPTLYEGLSKFPEPAKTSWFNFDHYYSDDAFPYAQEIVFKEQPKMLFDIGGNTGKWAISCCNYNPDVEITILDLPGQLNVAKKNVEDNGHLERVNFHQIDLLDTVQKIPAGADAVWMSQFLDCFSEEEIFNILSNVHQAASDKTSVFILEPFFDNQDYPAAQHSLIGTSLYFTIMANGNSKMYSRDKMMAIIERAGFRLEKEHRLIGDSFHTLLHCKKN